jgi:sugar lactone lactonase YvrE
MRPRLRDRSLAIVLLAALGGCGEPPAPEPGAASNPTGTPTSQVWQTGALIDGANGLQVGPDGRLYVASVVASGIFVLDPESGALAEFKEVDGPDDVAFAPDGTLCWTSILTGEIGCEQPDGTRVTAATLAPGVNPITFADDGRLFVAQCFFGHGLYEVDPAGNAPARLIRDDLGPGCGLNGMDWGPDDRLYGPRWFQGSVIAVDVATGEYETIADGFRTPAAVKFDATGTLHVLDTATGEIVKIGADGARTIVARLVEGMDNFDFAPGGRLFASSFADGFVAEVETPDSYRLITPGGVSMPNGVAVANGRLVVGDFFSIKRYDLASGEFAGTTRDVIGFSDLGIVTSLQGGAAGLVLSSWNDRTVKLWDPTSDRLIATVADAGRPIDAVQAGEFIYFTEYDSRTLRRARLDGSDATVVFESSGVPAGLAVDGTDLLIGDFEAGTIERMSATGERTVVARDLAEPEGIVASAGRIYVVENGARRVTEIDPRTGARRVLADRLAIGTPAQAGLPPTMLFTGITRDSAGNLYLGGETDNVVYRILEAIPKS